MLLFLSPASHLHIALLEFSILSLLTEAHTIRHHRPLPYCTLYVTAYTEGYNTKAALELHHTESSGLKNPTVA
jgi:hypothetical protein